MPHFYQEDLHSLSSDNEVRTTPWSLILSFIVHDGRLALHTGDAMAVAFIFKVINPVVQVLGSTEEALKKQLQNEYGVDVDPSLDVEPILPTHQEMDIAAAIIMKSDRATR
jgi:hypothetical protein